MFIGFDHDEFGSKDDSADSLLIVVNLDGLVKVALVGDDSGLVSSYSLKTQELLDSVVEAHFPELFVSFKHVGLATHRSDFTFSVVSDVDTFVSIKRYTLSLLEEFDLHWKSVSARPVDHPSVDCVTDSAVGLSVCLFGSEK